jgi:hypothetical protein
MAPKLETFFLKDGVHMLSRSVKSTFVLMLTLVSSTACVHQGSRQAKLRGETLRQDCALKGQALENTLVTIWSNNKRQIIRTSSASEIQDQILTSDGENSSHERSGTKTLRTSRNRVAADFNASWRQIADFWTSRHPETPAATAIRELFPKKKSESAETPLTVNFRIGPVTEGKTTNFVSSPEFSSASFEKPLYIPSPADTDWLRMPTSITLVGDDARKKNMLAMRPNETQRAGWTVIRSTWHKNELHPAQVIWQKKGSSRTGSQVELSCAPPVKSAEPTYLEAPGSTTEDLQLSDATNRMTESFVPVQFGLLTTMASLALSKTGQPKPEDVMKAFVAGFQVFCTDFVAQLGETKSKNTPQNFTQTAERLDHWLEKHPAGETWGISMMQIAAATGVPEELAPAFMATAAWAACVETTHPGLGDDKSPPQSFTEFWSPSRNQRQVR